MLRSCWPTRWRTGSRSAAAARKSTYLFLLLLPFFVSFVLRTISWQFILADNGIVLSPLKTRGLLPQNFHILATGTAVDRRARLQLPAVHGAADLRGAGADRPAAGRGGQRPVRRRRRAAFRRVVFPLSLPGVFAGVLLTFVPVSSDYVNAAVLGGTGNTMIGNIIQTQYLIEPATTRPRPRCRSC